MLFFSAAQSLFFLIARVRMAVAFRCFLAADQFSLPVTAGLMYMIRPFFLTADQFGLPVTAVAMGVSFAFFLTADQLFFVCIAHFVMGMFFLAADRVAFLRQRRAILSQAACHGADHQDGQQDPCHDRLSVFPVALIQLIQILSRKFLHFSTFLTHRFKAHFQNSIFVAGHTLHTALPTI